MDPVALLEIEHARQRSHLRHSPDWHNQDPRQVYGDAAESADRPPTERELNEAWDV